MIRHASSLSCDSLQHPVWRDLRDEMFAQVCREVCEAFVAQRLDGAYDSSGVNVVALGHFARREKKGFFVTVQNRSNQLTPAAAQLRLSEAKLKRRWRILTVSICTIQLLSGLLVSLL